MLDHERRKHGAATNGDVAVAPLDLPEDYDAYPMDYVPVAPLDLEDENATQAADSEVDEVALVSADVWMAP